MLLTNSVDSILLRLVFVEMFQNLSPSKGEVLKFNHISQFFFFGCKLFFWDISVENYTDNQILLTVYYILLLNIRGILKCIKTYNEESNLILCKIRVRILTYKNTDVAKKKPDDENRSRTSHSISV